MGSRHTQKIVKDSVNKTLPPLDICFSNDTEKHALSGCGLSNGFVMPDPDQNKSTTLIFPKALSPQEQKAASQLLTNCPDTAQDLLDVVAATLKAGKIHTSPLALLGALIRRQQAGTFDPTPGLKIRLDRERVVQQHQKIIKSIVVDKQAQKQNMAMLLSETQTHLSKR